jgi:hypothetical protein
MIFHDYNLLGTGIAPILRCNRSLPLCDGTGDFQKAQQEDQQPNPARYTMTNFVMMTIHNGHHCFFLRNR